ncbi:MAG: hypothetical protein ACAI44_36160, partial [Candidatus Sericytochromatia bacterium]
MGLMLLSACQPPAPVQDFRVKNTDPTRSDRLSLVPEDVFYSKGLAAFEQEAQHYLMDPPHPSSSGDFTTLDVPETTGCYSCGVNILSASLSWTPPANFRSSDTLTLGSPGFLLRPGRDGYSYGLHVLETGTNAQGQPIATKVLVGFSIRADDYVGNLGLTFGRYITHASGITFSSTDGLHFTQASSNAGMMGVEDALPTDSWCAYTYQMEGLVYPSSATLTLYPENQRAVLHAVYSGSLSGDGRNWLAPDPLRPYDKMCLTISAGGSANADVTLDFGVPFSQTADIAIKAEPGELPDAQGGRVSKVTVTATEQTETWMLEVASPNQEACPQDGQVGNGTQTYDFPWNPDQLTNGIYKLTAQYYDPLFGARDMAEIKVNLPVSLRAEPGEFHPLNGETVALAVQVPPCPKDWTLNLEGPMETTTGTGLTCKHQFSGSGNETKSWNGDCSGTDETGATVSGKARGIWTGTLKWSDQQRSVTVVAITAPGATPSPSGTPCPNPADCPLECPSGMLCGPGGGGGGGTSPSPGDGGSSSPGPGPTNDPNVSPSPGPTPDPGGTPSSGPTPPGETPGPTPTPSDSGGGDSCPGPDHHIQKINGVDVCVPCNKAFLYNAEHGCYTTLTFNVFPAEGIPEEAPFPLIISPRDLDPLHPPTENPQYDDLFFRIRAGSEAAKFVDWTLNIKASPRPEQTAPPKTLWELNGRGEPADTGGAEFEGQDIAFN